MDGDKKVNGFNLFNNSNKQHDFLKMEKYVRGNIVQKKIKMLLFTMMQMRKKKKQKLQMEKIKT